MKNKEYTDNLQIVEKNFKNSEIKLTGLNQKLKQTKQKIQ